MAGACSCESRQAQSHEGNEGQVPGLALEEVVPTVSASTSVDGVGEACSEQSQAEAVHFTGWRNGPYEVVA